MNEHKRTLIAYRFSRAREALEEARIMLKAEHYNQCASRLYYACFYAVSAVLLSKGHSASTHSGIRTLFNQHLVHPGLVTTELSKFYSQLFDARQSSDYKDLFTIDLALVEPWIEQTEIFIQALEILIQE